MPNKQQIIITATILSVLLLYITYFYRAPITNKGRLIPKTEMNKDIIEEVYKQFQREQNVSATVYESYYSIDTIKMNLDFGDIIGKDRQDLSALNKTTLAELPLVPIETNNILDGCDGVKINPQPLDYYNTDNITCVNLKVKPVTTICVHDPQADVYISRQILNDGIWEAHIVAKFQEVLNTVGTNVSVIDLGANIGMYSLIAAKKGHRVLAVEPFKENLRRFYKAIKLSGRSDLITVFENGVSDSPGRGVLVKNVDNQGDTRIEPVSDTSNASEIIDIITLNCLKPYLSNTSSVVIKIDIQGYEHRALAKFDQFVQSVYVPYIFMEWTTMRDFFQTELTASADKSETQYMVDLLYNLSYKPYSQVSGKLLKKRFWYGWPDDILWKHEVTESFINHNNT